MLFSLIVFFVAALWWFPTPDSPLLDPPHFTDFLDPKAPIFAIMGKTGVGKSTFIDLLGGREVKTKERPVVGDSLESCKFVSTVYTILKRMLFA
jgi:hypothetical protein